MRILQVATLVFILTSVSGSAYSQLWKQYADSAKIFSNQKNRDKAIELYTKAKEELKKDSLWTNTHARICDSLATLYANMSQYPKAEPLYVEAKQIREKALGKENTNYAASCNRLGWLYLLMGQHQTAEPLFLEAKQIQEKVLGKEHPDYAESCSDLAVLYMQMGQYEKAEPLFLMSKQIMENTVGKENVDYVKCCGNLAGLYYYTAHYEKAAQLYVEARQICEKVFGKQHSYYALSCNNLANLYADMGEYEKAKTLYLEAKQIQEKIVGSRHPDYAFSCANVAALYVEMGQYEKAEPLYLEARQILEKVFGKKHSYYALSCNSLALLYMDMGQYKMAELLYLEAKQIQETVLGKEHPDYAYSCDNLAVLYINMGEYAKAKPLLLEAKQIREKALGKEHSSYASSCFNLADLYSRMNEYKKAELLYLEAGQIWRKVFGIENPYYARSCNNLAKLYRQMNQYIKAESLFLKAQQIREKVFGKESAVYTESCVDLANLYWNLNKPEKANSFYAEAFTSQNAQVNKIFQFTTEVEKQSYLKTTADLEKYFLSFISTYSNYSDGSGYNVSLSNRNLILSSSRRLREEIYNTGDTSIKNKYSTWINLREQLAFWYAKPVAERPEYVSDLDKKANALEKEFTRLSSTFKKEQVQKDITWRTIQQNLKSNEAAIEFAKFNFYNGKRWTDSIYYVALLLTRNAEPKLVFLFEEKQLNKFLNVSSTSKTIAALYSKNEKTNSSYNLIWQPIEKHLQGITKVYFAPAGLLYRISFPALPINGHQVLSDKYQLIQLNTTASVAGRSENFIDTSDKIYLYGGIQYDVDSATLKQAVVAYRSSDESIEDIRFVQGDSTKGSTWLYLPGTEKEITEIENLGKQKNYSIAFSKGIEASEESFKVLDGKSSPSVIHIATHGFFYPDPKEKKDSIKSRVGSGHPFKKSDNPLFRSGLLFAGANNAWKGTPIGGVEDGVLTAYEVSNLYLPNTKLGVLSACETGLGDIQGNEGVYGLQRAFKIAGVENLIMSLWKVQDEQTAEFMKEFYKNIFDRQSINDAFFKAQTVMKNKYRNEPDKWAAWVLVK